MAEKNEIHTEAISALSSFGSRAPSDAEVEEFIDNLTVFDEAVSDEIKDALRADAALYVQKKANAADLASSLKTQDTKTGMLTPKALENIHWGVAPE